MKAIVEANPFANVTAVNLTGLVTDPTDWGQWYVGNWADNLTPPASTVYVDDVTIGFTQ